MAESPTELHTEIEKLEARHAEHPEGRYFVPLANAYRKLGDLDHAEELLREGLQQHPDYLSAHIVLGRCLADRGATPEAASEFQYVLSIDPQNLIALRTLGELEVAAGRPVEAARWYEQLLAVDPMNEEARRALDNLPAGNDAGLDSGLAVGGGWWDAPAASTATDPVAASSPSVSDALVPGGDSPFGRPPLPATTQRDLGRGPSAYDVDGEEIGLDAGAEVVTETIAELYARQGLHDRAAEVYRELIRRRGGDAALERKLSDLEALAAGGPLPEPVARQEPQAEDPAPSSPAEPSYAPDFATTDDYGNIEPDELPTLRWSESSAPSADDDLPLIDEDPFAASFAHGFAAGSDPEPVPLAASLERAPSPELLAPPAGPTIRHYLADLVSWRPRGAPEAAPPPAGPVAAPSTGPGELSPEPGVDESGDSRSGGDLGPAGPGEPLASAGDQRPAWLEPEPAEAGDSVLFPWETPGETDRESADSPDPVTEAAPDFRPARFQVADEPVPAPAEPAPEPAQPLAPPAPAAPAPEDEDDLESFQAWLRSLKR